MQLHKLLLVIFFAVLSISISAQDDREDVVYLKNGNIYRGIIIEQVPGETLKIETVGGNVFTVAISDIAKLTKEKKVMPDQPNGANGGYRGDDRHYDDRQYDNRRDDWHGDMHRSRYYRHPYDSSYHARREFHYRDRGYFLQGQLLAEIVEGGGRLVNGYKFGQFGYLGIGIGVDIIVKDLHMNSDYSGVYMPIYIHYGGDILRRRVTPFYSVEAGYSFHRQPNQNNNNNFLDGGLPEGDPNATRSHGGMMGGVGFGVKFYSRHRGFFSISMHLDGQRATNDYTQVFYNPGGGSVLSSYHNTVAIITPGIRFGFGF